jgi:diguanylate cyclase (GGDEF)-like protein/PAS domain S-box-containing protein
LRKGDIVSAAAIDRRDTAHSDRDALYGLIVESAREGVWVVDTEGETIFANSRMAELLAVEKIALEGGAIWDFLDVDASALVRERMARRQRGERDEYEVPFLRSDGQRRWLLVSAVPLPDSRGGVAGSIGLTTDITQRKETERQLRQLALYDSLTELPNRTLILDRMEQLVERRDDSGEEFAYLACDIDHLQQVNDRAGHAAGDQVVIEVARRLRDAARSSDFVGRVSGDEFVVLCPNADSYVAQRHAESLLAAVADPITLAGRTIQPSISIGVASTAEVRVEQLMTAAEGALFRAKNAGRQRVVTHDATLSFSAQPVSELVADLRHALDNNALELHYQPIVRLTDNTPLGFEALVRWRHPQRGQIAPATFVPLAEEHGLIRQLGAWALSRACRDAITWEGDPYVSVNLSGRQLTMPEIADDVRRALAISGLDPGRLTLEVTETAVVADVPAATQILRELAALGVCIALDDFGTGYSSLAYLRDFPIKVVKIDRSFTAGLGQNDDDTAIVATLISLATTLGLHVIAEGVETQMHLDLLRSLGCPLGQGHLWSAAVPAADVATVQRELSRRLGNPSVRPRQQRARRGRPPALITSRIMALHNNGASPATIAAALNADQLRTPGGARWHRNTVAQVIADLVAARPSAHS